MIGDCEFIHKVFCCPQCLDDIEFVTQTCLEDIDINIKKAEKFFSKNGREMTVKKSYETGDGKAVENIDAVKDIKFLCLTVFENNSAVVVLRYPIERKECWERPYYFDVPRNAIVNAIKRS